MGQCSIIGLIHYLGMGQCSITRLIDYLWIGQLNTFSYISGHENQRRQERHELCLHFQLLSLQSHGA